MSSFDPTYNRPRGARNPNNKTVYIQDINLLTYSGLRSKSGFFNWCLENRELVEQFNNEVVKGDRAAT